MISALIVYFLPDSVCERGSEDREPIENGDTDVNFGDLAVKVSCHKKLAEQFNTMHFRLDTTSPMITSPSSPDGTSEILTTPRGVIASYGSR